MQNTLILYPVFVLVALTFGVGMLMKRDRVRAVREGLDPGYFRHNRGGKLPDYLMQVTHNYDNLLEMPVLFYTVVLMAYATHWVDGLMVVLAWGYVLMRIAHSFVHIRGNIIPWRVQTFMLSSYFLAVMWLDLLYRLIVDAPTIN